MVSSSQLVTYRFRRTTCDRTVDSDGGGIGDCDEYDNGTDPNNAADDYDRDGDGVPDAADRCPDQAGPAATEGCPDSDGDGVADLDDAFPADPTEWADSDHDGIGDNSDPCPNDATNSCTAVCDSYRYDVDSKAGTLTSRLFIYETDVFYQICSVGGGAPTVDIRSVSEYGAVDPGVTAGLLESIGFSTPIEPRWTTVTKCLSRRFRMMVWAARLS